MTVQRSGLDTLMRCVVFASVIVLVCASAGVQAHASTECERWVAEYRAVLAHSNAVKRANAARHRLHRYMQRKIDVLVKPKTAPKLSVLPARHHWPPMSREEALRKFVLACGDLPEDAPALGDLPNEPMPAFIADNNKSDDDLPLDADTPSTLLVLNQASSYADGGVGVLIGEYGPDFYVPGFGGLGPGEGGPNAKTPTTTIIGGDDPPPFSPSVPTAETPEPGSLLLIGTGVAGVIRRRRRPPEQESAAAENLKRLWANNHSHFTKPC